MKIRNLTRQQQLALIVWVVVACAIITPLIALVAIKFADRGRQQMFNVEGALTIVPFTTSSTPNVIPGSWTGDCSVNQGDPSRRLCFSNVVSRVEMSVRSANCGSAVFASVDGRDSKCISVTEIRRG